MWLAGAAGVLRLDVADEGAGFASERVGAPEHLGLAGVREQAELLGGGFRVGRTKDGHTLVSVWWPLAEGET